MALKLLAEETNVPLTAAKANIGLATCMRLFNSHGTTAHLFTLTDSAGNTIGSFTIGPKEAVRVEKEADQKCFIDSGTDVKVTKIAFTT